MEYGSLPLRIEVGSRIPDCEDFIGIGGIIYICLLCIILFIVIRPLIGDKSDSLGCCGSPCEGSDECSLNLFCCPIHHVCMDKDTKSTVGPYCNSCVR